MELLLSVNWIALFALTVALLLFVLLSWLSDRINWTLVILLSLVLGAGLGIVFASENNSYLVWLDLIGDIYVNAITALVAPVILVSILSGFISLNDKQKMRSIGLRSVFWLMLSAAAGIVLSLVFGLGLGLGNGGGAVFADITSVSDSTVSAYEELRTSFDSVILALFPTNVIGDLSSNNVVAIIIIAVVLAIACVGVASDEGQGTVEPFIKVVEAVKKILFRVLAYVIDLTPYAVLCLVAGSASQIFANREAVLQLILLVSLIYGVSLIHIFGFNAILLKIWGKVSPLAFFRKIFQAQATAFTTQSSVGTLPVSIAALREKVGVDDEVANFTAPLGTTIGMPGCTCIWPVLLVIFYVNAAGLGWGVSEYLILALLTLVLSLGSAGVPGIAVVSAIAVFSAVNLPIAAVVLLMPINTISDMIRTTCNVTTADVAAALVARQTGALNDDVFNAEDVFNVEERKVSAVGQTAVREGV